MTKKKQKINKNVIISASIALVVLVAGIGIVKAGGSFSWERVEQWVGIAIADKIDAPLEDVTVGSAAVGPDIYNKLYLHEGMVKAASFYAPLNWSNGTTSGETTVITVAKMKNDTGKNLLCRDIWLDVSTARGIWGGDLAVGTTTDLSDDSLTATTTVSLIASNAITTTTVDILNKEDDEGTDANVYWEFDINEVIAVSDTFDTANATSGDSFLTAGGFTGVGAVGAECWYR